MKPDPSALNLSSAFEQLRNREYSALELTESFLEQIQHLNPLINAFITPTPELAVQGAMQADMLIANAPSNLKELILLGLPLGIKDMVDVAGVTTTGGSRFFAKNTPSEDAAVVIRIKLSGGVILGKTSTHEVALGVTGINPHYGAVKNPWNLCCITGGSSSGSAAAVASGMCLAAIGTDTGGSIRIPAALCGVVGFKPTYGRVSTHGVIPLSWNLDHVGPITRTVRDAALMMSVMAGFDPHDPESINIPVYDYLSQLNEGSETWRIALAAGEFIDASDPEVLEAVNTAAMVFKELGATVEKVDMSWLMELAQANGQMTTADGAAFHRDRLKEHPDWFGADVYQRLLTGSALSSSDYVLARRKQSEGRRRFEMFFEKYDFLLLPTTPVVASPIETMDSLKSAAQLTRFTSAFNLTGLPALSVPCGFSKTGLPIGLQIVSKYWAEAKVLQAGHAFEQASDWHNRHPKV